MKDINILTVKELADLLKMKESWVRQRVHHEQIPYFKIGNLVRFSQLDISNWLDTKREH